MKVTAYAGTKITDLAGIPETAIYDTPDTNAVKMLMNEDKRIKEPSSDILEDFIEMISERVKDKIYKEISEDMKKLRYK